MENKFPDILDYGILKELRELDDDPEHGFSANLVIEFRQQSRQTVSKIQEEMYVIISIDLFFD